jgi:hypothetical protein
MTQFGLDELAHLISSMPNMIDQSTNTLYNCLVRKLVANDYQYRYRYILYYVLDNENALTELKLWLKGESDASDIGIIGSWLSKYTLSAPPDEFKELATNLISKKSRMSCKLLIRKNELTEPQYLHALSNLRGSISSEFNWHFRNKHNSKKPVIEIKVSDLEKLPLSKRLSASKALLHDFSYTASHPGQVINNQHHDAKIIGTKDEFKRVLFPAMSTHSSEVTELLKWFDAMESFWKGLENDNA